MAPPSRIGTTIRRARERRRLSQTQAAKALGVSRSAVNAWENDRAYPRGSIGAIEALYGISLDAEPEPEPDIMPPGLRKRIYETLPPEEARRVEQVVEATLRGEPLPDFRRRRGGPG